MSIINRRKFITTTAGAAATLPLLGRQAFAQEPLKVGFVYLGPIGDYGWTFAHDLGRKEMQEKLGDKIKTTYVENVEEGPDAERVMRELAQQGNKLIFATSFGYMNYALKVAKQFPDVYFEHATGYQRAPNLATYNSRFYQGRSVIGTIAGHMSKSGVIGYLASFPIPEVVMGINAFTLAAQKVNPDITCKVIWANTWFDPAKEADAARAMLDQGVDVIATHTDSPAALQVAEERGAYGFGQGEDMSAFAPKAHLTAIVDEWGPYYVSRGQAVLDGTWKSQDTWWGMKEGSVEIAPYNPALPEDVVAAAEKVRIGITEGSYDPFAGPIYDQEGKERVPEGGTQDDGQLLSMDWYVKGVQS